MDKEEALKRAQERLDFYGSGAYKEAAPIYTVPEVAEALRTVAPALQQAWDTVIDDDALWRRREELYRTTFILGRFRWYRKFRVWWLRRQL